MMPTPYNMYEGVTKDQLEEHTKRLEDQAELFHKSAEFHRTLASGMEEDQTVGDAYSEGELDKLVQDFEEEEEG